jgi:hypothetical protein
MRADRRRHRRCPCGPHMAIDCSEGDGAGAGIEHDAAHRQRVAGEAHRPIGIEMPERRLSEPGAFGLAGDDAGDRRRPGHRFHPPYGCRDYRSVLLRKILAGRPPLGHGRPALRWPGRHGCAQPARDTSGDARRECVPTSLPPASMRATRWFRRRRDGAPPRGEKYSGRARVAGPCPPGRRSAPE